MPSLSCKSSSVLMRLWSLATQVYQIWMGHPVTWVVGFVVLVLPVLVLVGVTLSHLNRVLAVGEEPDTTEYLLGAAMLAPFSRRCVWFGALLLLDRLAFATILILASHRPLLQVLLVSASALVQVLFLQPRPWSTLPMCESSCGVMQRCLHTGTKHPNFLPLYGRPSAGDWCSQPCSLAVVPIGTPAFNASRSSWPYSAW